MVVSVRNGRGTLGSSELSISEFMAQMVGGFYLIVEETNTIPHFYVLRTTHLSHCATDFNFDYYQSLIRKRNWLG